jgi:hypothetical protein
MVRSLWLIRSAPAPLFLERTHPLALRDMERVCTLCRHKARCDMDLADGTSAEYFSSYCPNESTIKQLERTGAARRV